MKNMDLFKMPGIQVETRWFTFENTKGAKGAGGTANFGRKGAPCTMIKAGETLTLADIEGSGTIRRIWSTLWYRDVDALRGLKLEFYWDGAASPAVQVPFGDFFCHSHGQMATFENECFSSPEGRSFNCFIPMPFRTGARVLLINESARDNGIYYELDTTLGDVHDVNTLYFHSYWRRENYSTLRRDMAILPQVYGKGRFLGCNLGIQQNPSMNNFWWGEGEVKMYIDGDTDYPTLCGTGTEDYIGTGYGQGLFSNRYQGNHYISQSGEGESVMDAYGFYRLHIPDPVYFYKDIRVTIQVMGGPSFQAMLDSLVKDPSVVFMKAGDGTQFYSREELEAEPQRAEAMERIDDYTATAYWYMDSPENGLPPIAPFKERVKDLG
ncbi:MAG: glycoside hydrolase family 172 protein [Armatimonadota bacterium]